jgi:hypothetical protein
MKECHEKYFMDIEEISGFTTSEARNKNKKLESNDLIIKAMTLRIATLENELKTAIKNNRDTSRKLQKILHDKNDFEIKLSKYFEKDQIALIRGKKKVKWSSKTIAKALFIRRKGKSVLQSVRLHIAPLPSLNTLNKHLEKIDFAPGIIDSNIKVLAKKCQSLKESENYFCIGFDEMATIPGISKDPSSKNYLGSVTLPPRLNVQSDQLLLFTAMGLKIRIKSNVAFHFTKKGVTTGDDLKKFIFELICRLEKEVNILIKGLSFDLSALDCSLIKSLGIKFNIENKTHYFDHPSRNDKVYLHPDGTHNSKNLNQGLKNKDILIAQSIQEEFNLESNRATLKDVEKIFKNDSNSNFKLMPNVTDVVLHTKHYQKMNPLNASKFHSTDVISALKLKSNSPTSNAQKNDKQNATAFILTCFYHYHKIVTSTEPWSKNNIQKYNDDIEYLEWFADRLLLNIQIGQGKMKSVFGARMGIYSLISLSKLCFDQGFDEFIPSRVLTNAVENQFSSLRDLTPKPSAVNVKQSLRIMSACPFQFHPINGVYKWDEIDPKNISYLEIIKEMSSNSEETSPETTHTNDEMEISISIKVPQNIQWKQLMKNQNDPLREYEAFVCHMSILLNKIIPKTKCEHCASWMMVNEEHSLNRIEGFALLKMRLQYDTKNYKFTPSLENLKFMLRLEFVFQSLSIQLNPSEPKFEEIFLDNIPDIDEIETLPHCFEMTLAIASAYINYRLKSALHCRHLQKAQKFASASYANIG